MNTFYQRPRPAMSEYLGIGTYPSAMDCEIEFKCKRCGAKVRTRSRIKAKCGRCDECQAKANREGQIEANERRKAKRRAGR